MKGYTSHNFWYTATFE